MNIITLVEAAFMVAATVIGVRRWSRVNKAGKYLIAGVWLATLGAVSRFLVYYGAIADANWGVMAGKMPLITLLYTCGAAVMFFLGLYQMRG
ncbi:MAG: hypothetical protein JXA21_12100 [Anaerolineae bacterium]|nr:hypothetical protein [Anaerolineae bacterium]